MATARKTASARSGKADGDATRVPERKAVSVKSATKTVEPKRAAPVKPVVKRPAAAPTAARQPAAKPLAKAVATKKAAVKKAASSPATKAAGVKSPKPRAPKPAVKSGVKSGAAAKKAGSAPVAKKLAVPLTPTVVRPAYWEQACADLVKRDRILKKLIPQFGPVHLMARGEPFVTLARSIIGQQISVKAAQTVWERFQVLCPTLLPAAVVALGYEQLATCGLSKRKAEYILDLGQHFVNGALHVDRWSSMDDEDVIAELIQIRGIGRWTAEMFLIFNLMRPDVLPLDDLGLIKAISVNYFSGEPVTRSEAREVAANWEPWRTVATWYMWRSLEPLPAA